MVSNSIAESKINGDGNGAKGNDEPPQFSRCNLMVFCITPGNLGAAIMRVGSFGGPHCQYLRWLNLRSHHGVLQLPIPWSEHGSRCSGHLTRGTFALKGVRN